jgi:hypothetical protein
MLPKAKWSEGWLMRGPSAGGFLPRLLFVIH